jgi:hypothetical protein
MADPVSWLMIEPGWRVVTADGAELGLVDSVRGDTSADIFDGLDVRAGGRETTRYVPAESVGSIFPGEIHLT